MLKILSKPVLLRVHNGDLRTDAKEKSDYSYPNSFFTRKKVKFSNPRSRPYF
jgi:hypothetical protein